MEDGRRHEPDRRFSLHAGSVPDHEGAGSPGWADHQQWLDLGPYPAAELIAVHLDEACRHRPYQGYLARRPQIRHRLRPDRHWQRRDAGDDENIDRIAAAERLDDARAADGRA